MNASSIVEREIFIEVVKKSLWISDRIFVSLNEFFSCNFSQELVNGQRSDNISIYSACTVYIDTYQQVFTEYQANCK